MTDGSFGNSGLTRLSLGLTLVLLVLFWATNFAMYFERMSLAPSSVVAYYNGSEEDFRPARSAASMLETTHMHLPMMGLVLLMLTHLVVFLPLARRAKAAAIVSAFAFAVLEESGGWLVRFVSPSLGILKVVGFLGLQATLGFLLVALGAQVIRARRRNGLPRESPGVDVEAVPLPAD